MLVIAPATRSRLRRELGQPPDRERSLELVCARTVEVDADLAACEADIKSWLALHAAPGTGPGSTATPSGRSCGATGGAWSTTGRPRRRCRPSSTRCSTAGSGAGVKPARAADGWIDEAWTTWATSSRRAEQPRFAAEELPLDEPPVELYPQHPWARHTRWRPTPTAPGSSPVWRSSSAVRSGCAAAMADWYRANAGPGGHDRRPGRPSHRLVRGRHRPVVGPLRPRPGLMPGQSVRVPTGTRPSLQLIGHRCPKSAVYSK